jgi:hypothetical protein
VRARTFSIEGVNLATDLDDALRTNLSPQRVIEDASGSEDRFLARYGDTQLLLVKLQTGAEALEMGLSVSQRSALSRVQPSIRVMGFETQVLGENQLRELNASTLGRADQRVERLNWALRGDRYFVMPLRKRTDDATFLDRVSVGRATNKDIVLRHPSVSKFHAWFEMDDTNALYLADADSTNGSFLNAKKLPPRELLRVNSADQVTFGSIECLACDPADFWRAVRNTSTKHPRSA